MELNRREIPRFARNDKIEHFIRSLFSLSYTRRLQCQRLAELRVRRGKIFRLEARFADSGHEIRVAHPPWHEVHMEMISNAGAGRAAQIHAQVEAVRMVDVIDRRHQALRE